MVCHDTAPGTKSEGMWHAILFVLARTVGILKVRNLRHERTPKAYLTQSNRPQWRYKNIETDFQASKQFKSQFKNRVLSSCPVHHHYFEEFVAFLKHRPHPAFKKSRHISRGLERVATRLKDVAEKSEDTIDILVRVTDRQVVVTSLVKVVRCD